MHCVWIWTHTWGAFIKTSTCWVLFGACFLGVIIIFEERVCKSLQIFWSQNFAIFSTGWFFTWLSLFFSERAVSTGSHFSLFIHELVVYEPELWLGHKAFVGWRIWKSFVGDFICFHETGIWDRWFYQRHIKGRVVVAFLQGSDRVLVLDCAQFLVLEHGLVFYHRRR